MLISETLNKYIYDLDKKRLDLLEKHKKTIGWHVAIPVMVFIASLFIFTEPPLTFVPGFIAAIISAAIHYSKIGMPFNDIKGELKTAILKDLMDTFHPDVEYTYHDSKQDVRKIARDTGFFNANRYKEEDVIQGKYNNVDFYLSEVHLSKKKKKSRVTVFDGLLFKIRIPGKSFPRARIQSSLGLLSHIFGEYKLNEEFGFHYDTDNPTLLQETLGDLFPFFRHLIETNDELRISIQGNEIVMFLNSDMKFLDDPEPRLKESLLNNFYVENFAKQLNSLLFIVETLANNLNHQEIEERLELKVLEYSNKYMKETRS
jgi:hypothetical protein